jgi:zinc protease
VRGALDISRDVDRLGATLQTGAYADYAFASLTTLKKNLAPAGAILADVVVKPTFSAAEWKRVHDLSTNELRARASDPDAVANVVSLRQLFGDEPYGHPTNGTLKSAAKINLEDVKRFYGSTWRPERATCVVVGDVTRAELDPLLDSMFGTWKATGPAAVSSVAPSPLAPKSRTLRPMSVLILASSVRCTAPGGACRLASK